MRKLNMWTRLGIVLSVVWAVGIGGYVYDDTITRATNEGAFAAHTCDEARALNNQAPSEDACWTDANSPFMQSYKINASGAFMGALGAAFLPLPFFWLITWGIVATVRWVLRGRDVTA